MTKILIGRGDTDLDYPICRPSLDLDFTQEELDPRITFTRGSTGTRVNRNRLIETVAANQPRFDYDPVTGECKGLLIEESRVNSWLYSGQNVTTGWSSTASTISFDNTQTAPDGSTNTIKFTERAVYTGGMGFSQTLSVTSGTSYTFSIFAKQPTGSPTRYCSILLFNTGFGEFKIATFNPTNGSVLYTSGTLTTSVQQYPNGWWRFSVTGTATSTTTSQFAVRFTNSISFSVGGGPFGNYTGDGSSYLYFFGPQVENGAFITSYIPTTASTVTRSADVVSITGTNFSSWYNPSEGTVFANINMNGIQITSFNRLWCFTNSNLNVDGYGYFISASSAADGRYGISAEINAIPMFYPNNIITTASVISVFNTPKTKSCFGFLKGGKSNLAINGVLPTPTGTNIRDFPVADRLLIGQPQRFQLTSCMTISRFTYYPRRLKDNQLVLLTQ